MAASGWRSPVVQPFRSGEPEGRPGAWAGCGGSRLDLGSRGSDSRPAAPGSGLTNPLRRRASLASRGAAVSSRCRVGRSSCKERGQHLASLILDGDSQRSGPEHMTRLAENLIVEQSLDRVLSRFVIRKVDRQRMIPVAAEYAKTISWHSHLSSGHLTVAIGMPACPNTKAGPGCRSPQPGCRERCGALPLRPAELR